MFAANNWPQLGGAFLVGYLLGSIPFGLLLTRLAGLGDIRRIGSGNIGATNVLRTGRKGLAAATLLLDGAKGALAVVIGAQFGLGLALAAGAGALLGHCFPVWLRFRGGKGVATALGVLLAAVPAAGVLVCLTWLGAAVLGRRSSLAAIAGLALAPVYALALTLAGWGWADVPRTWFALFVAIVSIARHHANIRRLLAGTEPKIGAGKPAADGPS